MLRREPSRIEMKPEDIEEFDARAPARTRETHRNRVARRRPTDKTRKASRGGRPTRLDGSAPPWPRQPWPGTPRHPWPGTPRHPWPSTPRQLWPGTPRQPWGRTAAGPATARADRDAATVRVDRNAATARARIAARPHAAATARRIGPGRRDGVRRYVAQQKRAAKDDAGAPESKKDRSKAERDARIGVRRPADPMTDSPGS